jgi:glutamate synthase (NADPH/NADH) small chain
VGKVDGFLIEARAAAHRRPVGLRVLDWKEVEVDAEVDESRKQAGRCMDCGVPFCTNGCPLGNPIPDFADAVWREDWQAAARWLATTNEFPEFTGRVCPAPCEAACVLAVNDHAVTIESLERAISERAFAEGWIAPAPKRSRSGRRVAVVGSGPAGVAAAAALDRAGHTVIIYEAAARAGGLLRYGIPDFKLEKYIIDRRLAILTASGVELHCGVTIDDWARLRADHDALVVAIGAQRPRELELPGRQLAGVVLAMDYLTDQNQVVGGERPAANLDVRGKRVVILGGGDTGSDCLGTALRQGAAAVTQIELMPAPPMARAAENAWPMWPLVFRTSSSQEEGGAREFAFRTTRLVGEAGCVVGLEGVRVERTPEGSVRDVSGSELRIPADVVILALGFVGPSARPLVEQLGVRLDGRGNLLVDAHFETTAPGVFCAGDAHRGASLVVWAIAEGRDCAVHVDAYLRRGSRRG